MSLLNFLVRGGLKRIDDTITCMYLTKCVVLFCGSVWISVLGQYITTGTEYIEEKKNATAKLLLNCFFLFQAYTFSYPLIRLLILPLSVY